MNMIIGGAYGASDELETKADLILSASQLTFPHRLFKILLMEQIYRASAINRNHPYHK
jgi:23S rRNA (pseudouridine1915-N3)-methyltransferase